MRNRGYPSAGPALSADQMPPPPPAMAGYAHAATLATADPDLAVRLAGELREAREAIQRVRVWAAKSPEFGIQHWDHVWDRARREVLAALDPPDGAA